MKTYEVYLACLFCGAERVLGTVPAESAYDAKQQAERLWPDVRYEELHARLATPCVRHQGRLEGNGGWEGMKPVTGAPIGQAC